VVRYGIPLRLKPYVQGSHKDLVDKAKQVVKWCVSVFSAYKSPDPLKP